MSIDDFDGSVFRKEPNGVTLIMTDVIQSIRNTGALAIYLYLASKPDAFKIDISELENHFKKSRRFITSKLDYLIKNGFIAE